MKFDTKFLLGENSYEIMNFYLKPYHQHTKLKQGQNISNPLLKEKQQTPSFNIFFSKKQNTWFYHDFATGDKGNCIELVKKIFNISFRGALEKIANDLSLKMTNDVSNFSANLHSEKPLNRLKEIPLEKKHFSNKEIDYWMEYGISIEILNKYGVFPLKEIYGQKAIENDLVFDPIFCYSYSGANKIYRPFSKRQKFSYTGTKNEDFYFGFEQLPESGDLVLITGGEKDVMSLNAKGFDAICLNSETANPSESLIKILKTKFDTVAVLYDTDETGIRRSKEISIIHDLVRIEIPAQGALKDISDLFKNKFTTDDLGKIIEKTLNHMTPENLNEKQGSWSNISNSPLISEAVYDNLPLFLKDICMVHNDRRSRDVVFTSALTLISGALPKVRGEYMGRNYYPNLYCFVIAPAASGKGNMGIIRHLGECIHEDLKMKSNDQFAKFKEQQKAYKKLKDSTDIPEPTKPKYIVLFIPANSSASAMLSQLEQNDGTGIIFDTEADAAGNALKQDWGNYSEMLRKAWHHEAISCLRRAEMQFTEVAEPRLCVLLSGTPSQVNGIIKSAEDGLMSRILYYAFAGKPEWLDVSPEGNKTNLTQHYKQMGRKLKDMYDYYNQNPSKFDLKAEQWDKLNKLCEQRLKEVHTLFDEDATSVVKRLGVIWFRIAMILTSIRNYEEKNKTCEMVCSENDFNTAQLLFETYLTHSKLVYSNLSKVSTLLNPAKQRFYDRLPDISFTNQDANAIGAEFNLKERSVRLYLRQLCKVGLLETVKLGTYKKL